MRRIESWQLVRLFQAYQDRFVHTLSWRVTRVAT
jgi:hypothetical protein